MVDDSAVGCGQSGSELPASGSSAPGPTRREWLEGRIRLAELLCEAAELEHGLLCKYLFAAFSLKREAWEDVTASQLELLRGWEGVLFLIARQEMEHLALVCNLLTAIGEAPYLRRPNFPVSGRHYPLGIVCELEAFGKCALRRFVEFEMPTNPDPGQLSAIGISFDPKQHTTIGRLYREIEALFMLLDDGPLFVGPASGQLTTSPAPEPRGLTLASGPSYQVTISQITTIEDAYAAVQQIITEGEGGPGSPAESHFSRLCETYAALEAECAQSNSFDPARRVMLVKAHQTGVDARDRLPLGGIALELVELFDLAYQTLILLLIRFIAHSHDRHGEVDALQNAAFFPMMTAVVRPLGEIITQTPISAASSVMAAPRFGFDRELSLLPHRHSAEMTIQAHLDLLVERARECTESAELDAALRVRAQRSAVGARDVRPRLRLIFENLSRIAQSFNLTVEPAQ